MSGTISLSLTQRVDNITHEPLNGGRLYFIQAGTTSTPQNAYQDSALTLPWPNPLTLDEGGNIPQLFFDDGAIKIRLTNAAGVIQLVADNIQVIGSSSGGGGGGTVDPTTVMQTGFLAPYYGVGIRSGFVRCNGRTIGSSSSGATERANLDTQALFEYLWNTDSNLTVSTGRGASSSADWIANKTIALPEGRGRSLTGLDDMGNIPVGMFTGSTFTSGSATTLGSRIGSGAPRTILTANLPPYTPSGTNGSVSGTGKVVQVSQTGGPVNALAEPATGPIVDGWGLSGPTFTGTAQGGTSSPFDTLSPMILITIYIKL